MYYYKHKQNNMLQLHKNC